MLKPGLRIVLAGFLVLPLMRCAAGPGTGRAEMKLALPGGATIEFVQIPPGKFLMGAPDDQLDRGISEIPRHEVTITRGFWCGKYEVTNRQFRAFRPEHVSASEKGVVRAFNGDDQPVVQVSLLDAQAFCRWASEKTGRTVRLPTEAEWEYVCRAGTTTSMSFGDDRSKLVDYCWYSKNANSTKPVGLKKPNNWGLYDMHGNAAEWIPDKFGYYAEGPCADPKGPSGGENFWRECSWTSQAYEARCSARGDRCGPDHKAASLGFRVVCEE